NSYGTVSFTANGTSYTYNSTLYAISTSGNQGTVTGTDPANSSNSLVLRVGGTGSGTYPGSALNSIAFFKGGNSYININTVAGAYT
ncbi:hypothetical protein ABTL25_19910, partial [Acinetobacter baumannii]